MLYLSRTNLLLLYVFHVKTGFNRMGSIDKRIKNKTLILSTAAPDSKQSIQEQTVNNRVYSYKPKLGETSKNCIKIANQIVNNPETKLSGEGLTLMRGHKRELKGKVKTLQNRDKQVTKKKY